MNLIGIFYSIIRRFYGIRDSELSGIYDLVVAMDYGTLLSWWIKILPKATVATLTFAANAVASGKAKRMSWGDTDRFGVPVVEIVKAKLKLLASHGLDKRSVTSIESVNSVTEVETILAANPGVARILVICDWRHTRRLRRVWQHFFHGELAFVSVNPDWDEDHPSWFCRSNFRWLLGNIAHDLIMKVRGVEAMRGLAHPGKK